MNWCTASRQQPLCSRDECSSLFPYSGLRLIISRLSHVSDTLNLEAPRTLSRGFRFIEGATERARRYSARLSLPHQNVVTLPDSESMAMTILLPSTSDLVIETVSVRYLSAYCNGSTPLSN